MDVNFKTALEEMGMDVDNTLKRFMGNEALYLKFLNKYQADQSVANIQKYIAEQNAEEIFKSAHTLKGVAANLGLDPIARCASDIVEVFRGKTLFSEADTDKANALNEELKNTHEALLKLLAEQQ